MLSLQEASIKYFEEDRTINFKQFAIIYIRKYTSEYKNKQNNTNGSDINELIHSAIRIVRKCKNRQVQNLLYHEAKHLAEHFSLDGNNGIRKIYEMEAIQFGKENDIAIMNDACYTEVTFDGYEAPSILQVPGAKDIAVEFHSFSKTFNMTGWRLGFAVGNEKLVQSLLTVKSNLDSGVPQAIQYMGIEALKNSTEFLNKNNAIYEKRRNKLVKALREIGLEVPVPKAGLYLWCKIPNEYTSAQFTELLLEKCDVVVTPGTGYGSSGEGFVRLSLTTPDNLVDIGIERISKWNSI